MRSSLQFPLAGVELGHLNQVGHQVVELFRFVAGGGNQFGLQRRQLAAEALAQRVQSPAQLGQRVAQLAAGDGDELRLEAVGVLQRGNIFKGGDSAQQVAFGVAHGHGAQAVAALMLAESHGQHGRVALGGHSFLHGDRVANGAEDLVAAGSIGQGHAVVASVAKQLCRGLDSP